MQTDRLIESLQDLLIKKAKECRQRVEGAQVTPNNAWIEQHARQLFDEYAGGIRDCVDQLDNGELPGVVSAFVAAERPTLSGDERRDHEQ